MGPEAEAFHSVEMQGAERCLGLECARVQLPSRPVLPVLSFQILLPYPPLPSRYPPLTTTSVVAAVGEPGRSWTAARRPHRGPRAGGGLCEGGRPRSWPGLSRAPARTLPISEEPLRGAGGWGNRLLAVTDDAEGVAVMDRTTPFLKGVWFCLSPQLPRHRRSPPAACFPTRPHL